MNWLEEILLGDLKVHTETVKVIQKLADKINELETRVSELEEKVSILTMLDNAKERNDA